MIKLKVEKLANGPDVETIELEPNVLTSWQLLMDLGQDQAALGRIGNAGVKLSGNIYPGTLGTAGDSTGKLAAWAAIGTSNAKNMRKVTVDVIANKVVERTFVLNCAYVASYSEDNSVESGIGSFEIVIRNNRAATWSKDNRFQVNAKGVKYDDDKKS